MSEKASKVAQDLPDWSQLEEHGIAIDAPTPTEFSVPNPWTSAGNGQQPPPSSDQGAEPAGPAAENGE